MRKYLIIVWLIFAIGPLAACGPDGPRVLQGPVVGREYDTPDTWTTSYCVMYQRIGDVNMCVMWDHETHHDGPHWRLQLSCRVGDDDHRSWVEVTEDTYDEFDFNDSYPDEGPCVTEESDGG